MKKLDGNYKTEEQLIFQLKSMIDALPGDVYWKNIDGIWSGLNQHCADSLKRMGFIKEAKEFYVIGKTDYDLFDKKTADGYRKNDLEVMNKRIEITIEEATQLPNGDIVTLLSKKRPFLDKDDNLLGIIGNSIDISDRKKMEAELIKAKEAAEAANHAKTEFIANMSHDIRTPLTGVIGLSEILENSLEDPEQKEDAHLLHNSGEELLSMLNDILDDIRAENMHERDIHEETFDLYECVQDLVRLESPTTKLKHLELRVNIAPQVPQYIISDRKKIHRILLNLLGNAIKFTQSGHISIAIKCLGSSKSKVHLQFGVSDTGVGIPEKLQAQVFDRFFRASSSYKGLYTGHGLGLHIAESYVHLLGGKITLTSEERVGSTFNFDLSCKLGDKNQIKEKRLSISQEPITPSKDESNPHLLLIEDNMVALKVLESLVAKAGFQFVAVNNGEEALELVKSMPFDLIITDIGLTGISGNELTRLIRVWERAENKTAIPIIGLTGHAGETAKAESLACGMNDVFCKPMSLSVLKKMISQFVSNAGDRAIPAQKLGPDLPDTEEELFSLDAFPLFDPDHTLQQINDLSLLSDMIREFISSEAEDDFAKIKQAYAQKDWDQIEKIAHKLKGGAVYIGTTRLQYACLYLERYYKTGHRVLLDKLYHQLISAYQETNAVLREWLQKQENGVL